MQFNKAFTAVLLAGVLVAPPVLGGGGMTGGATEITQMMNNGLLAKGVANDALMIAQEIQQATTLMNQYTTMIKNLQQLPSMVVQEMLGPFGKDLKTYFEAASAVNNLYTAGVNAQKVFETRAAEMANFSAAGFDPKYYLAHEAELAGRRAEVKTIMDADLDTLKNYEQRLAAYQQASKNIDSIDSNTKGMQTLASLSNAQLSEMNEINKQLRQQIAETHHSESKALYYADQRAKQETLRQQQREAIVKDAEAFGKNFVAPDPARNLKQYIK